MKVQKGSVVKANAGRDSGGYFVVTELRDGYCYIADGKRRKLGSPKKKNLKHISITGSVMELDGMTDRKLRRQINQLKNADAQ